MNGLTRRLEIQVQQISRRIGPRAVDANPDDRVPFANAVDSGRTPRVLDDFLACDRQVGAGDTRRVADTQHQLAVAALRGGGPGVSESAGRRAEDQTRGGHGYPEAIRQWRWNHAFWVCVAPVFPRLHRLSTTFFAAGCDNQTGIPGGFTMHTSARTTFFFVTSAALLAFCSPTAADGPSVPTGLWGGQHIRLEVTGTGG